MENEGKAESTSCQHTQNPDLHPILRTRRRGQLASQMAKARAVVGATGEILMHRHLYRERVYVKVCGSPSAFGLSPLIMFQLFMGLRWISAKPRVNFTKSNFTKRLQPWFCECVLEKDRNVMITYNIYIVIRETGQFSSKGIINDFIGNLNRLTVSRRFTEQAV